MNMADKDQGSIDEMKKIIDWQHGIIKKRETLVKAITHNVQYLAIIHASNAAEFSLTKEKLAAVEKWNQKLQEENNTLNASNSTLLKDQNELHNKRKEI